MSRLGLATFPMIGRSAEIRTRDPQNPILVRYQTALRSDLMPCFVSISGYCNAPFQVRYLTPTEHICLISVDVVTDDEVKLCIPVLPPPAFRRSGVLCSLAASQWDYRKPVLIYAVTRGDKLTIWS